MRSFVRICACAALALTACSRRASSKAEAPSVRDERPAAETPARATPAERGNSATATGRVGSAVGGGALEAKHEGSSGGASDAMRVGTSGGGSAQEAKRPGSPIGGGAPEVKRVGGSTGGVDAKREAALAAAEAVLRAAEADAGATGSPEGPAQVATDPSPPAEDSVVQADAGVGVAAEDPAVATRSAPDGGAPNLAASSGDLFIAACLGGLDRKGTAILIAIAGDRGLVPVDLIDPGLARRVAALAWYRPDSPAPIHFDSPKRIEETRQVEAESAENVSASKLALGPCEEASGALYVLATRPLAPAIWEGKTTRSAEIPDDARPETGPEPLELPFQRVTADEAPAPAQIDLTVRHLAGSPFYELRGTGPANCWSLELSPDADPTCTPNQPSESLVSVDSREEGWARLLNTDRWLGVRHVYTSGPEGGREKLEVIALGADGKLTGTDLVLSSSSD